MWQVIHKHFYQLNIFFVWAKGPMFNWNTCWNMKPIGFDQKEKPIRAQIKLETHRGDDHNSYMQLFWRIQKSVFEHSASTNYPLQVCFITHFASSCFEFWERNPITKDWVFYTSDILPQINSNCINENLKSNV